MFNVSAAPSVCSSCGVLYATFEFKYIIRNLGFYYVSVVAAANEARRASSDGWMDVCRATKRRI